MPPVCVGPKGNHSSCSITYADYSIATGEIKFSNFKKESRLLSVNDINRETTLYQESFRRSLITELKYNLYNEFDFTKNFTITSTRSIVELDEPMLLVKYHLRMSKTYHSIAEENPLPREMTMQFGIYEAHTKEEWSKISGKKTC